MKRRYLLTKKSTSKKSNWIDVENLISVITKTNPNHTNDWLIYCTVNEGYIVKNAIKYGVGYVVTLNRKSFDLNNVIEISNDMNYETY